MSKSLKGSSLLPGLLCVIAAAVVACAVYALPSFSRRDLTIVGVLTLSAVIANRLGVRRNAAGQWSWRALTDASIFFAAMSVGVAAATILAAADGVSRLHRGADRRKSLIGICSSVIAVATTSLLYVQSVRLIEFGLTYKLFSFDDAGALPLGALILPLCLMVAAQIFLRALLTRLCSSEIEQKTFSVSDKVEDGIRATLTRTAALTRWAGAAAAILVYATLEGRSLIFLIVGGFIILLVHLLYRFNEERIAEVERREREKIRHIEEMATLHINTIESLAIAIDAKDQTTHGHVRRTQIYAMQLGKYLTLTAGEMQALEAGALLHDVGKLAVPEYILNKPGKLTAAEFQKMKIHTVVGGDIIKRVGFPYPVEDIVRFHHEKWDGTGYPRGLREEQIPIVARIIAVVDFYDATRCDRPYRRGMKREESLALISSMAGTSFDPRVVDMFIEHIEELDALIAAHDINEQVASDTTEMTAAAPDAGLAADKLGAQDGADDAGYESIVAAQREVFALHEIAQTIGSSLDLKDTVTLITSKLPKIVPYDTCIIYLTDEQSGKAHAVHAAGANAASYQDRRITIGEGVSGWVIANGRSMCNTPPELDLVGIDEEAARRVRALLSAPLVGDGAAFGAITLLSERRASYTSEHVRLLESVAQYAAAALNNALTYERTKESALSDVLTNLPNARALRFMLGQQLGESARFHNEPLAILALDFADFKRVNEQHGRDAGDRVIVEAAQLIKSQLRNMDTLARFTGDEFIALLPMASADVALQIADSIRAAFESHRFIIRGTHAVTLSVNTGVACRPEHGAGVEELLDAAESQLLHNKRSRRTDFPVDALDLYPSFEVAR